MKIKLIFSREERKKQYPRHIETVAFPENKESALESKLKTMLGEINLNKNDMLGMVALKGGENDEMMRLLTNQQLWRRGVELMIVEEHMGGRTQQQFFKGY